MSAAPAGALLGRSYRPVTGYRLADAELDAALDAAGWVLIECPRACGKTCAALKEDSTRTALTPAVADWAGP